jgi:hypothetical protein
VSYNLFFVNDGRRLRQIDEGVDCNPGDYTTSRSGSDAKDGLAWRAGVEWGCAVVGWDPRLRVELGRPNLQSAG